MAGMVRCLLCALIGAGGVFAQEEPVAPAADCAFRANPDEFLSREGRARRNVFDRMEKLAKALPRSAAAQAVSPAEIERRNFIDIAIFDRMGDAGILSAAPSSDEEFVRRIYLDLTGRTPSPEDVRGFLSDAAADKRSRLIDRLLYAPEFIDRWTMWLGDLIQIAQVMSGFDRGFQARNGYHNYARVAIGANRSLKDIAYELITGGGDTSVYEEAQANFTLNARTTGGPVQDNYDSMFARSASTFLGLSHYDCLMCHDGRRHLDALSLWGKNGTRLDAYKMAAFFSRTNLALVNRLWTVSDSATGNYALNTNFGNRPARVPIGTIRNVNPEYVHTGAVPSDGNWRAAFAESVISDPLFAINMANRVWKAVFNLGLIEPVDALDPARLDPDNPPGGDWPLQATHPELLRQLAAKMVEVDFNLREFLRPLVESSAYQLSSRYGGEWSVEYVPYFARHFARRLEGEEIHDALVASTGNMIPYTVNGWAEPTPWAVKLPEPVEPRTNGVAAGFMNTFFRGNRDTLPRNQSGSILQQLFLMNSGFVTNKITMNGSPRLQAVARLPGPDAMVEEMFLAFLSRKPTGSERAVAVGHLQAATTNAQRNAALEDLAWALVNKLEFIFSY
jgi:hypothetical protein